MMKSSISKKYATTFIGTKEYFINQAELCVLVPELHLAQDHIEP